MGMSVIGEIRDRIPQAIGLTLDLDSIARLAVGALGLAMLIFPEGVLLGRALAEKHGYEVDADRELLALGSANIASIRLWKSCDRFLKNSSRRALKWRSREHHYRCAN